MKDENEPTPNLSYFMDKHIFNHILWFGWLGNVIVIIIGFILMTRCAAVLTEMWIISRIFDWSPFWGLLLLFVDLFFLHYEVTERRSGHY